MSILNHKLPKVSIYLFIGFLIRLWTTFNFKEALRKRIEITTPIGDWKRACEAVHLWAVGLNPYSGNLFHEYPISLQFYKILVSYFPIEIVFVSVDVVTAILLYLSVRNQLNTSDCTNQEASSRSIKVLSLYLFSPLTIVACAGLSTSIFTNFLFATITYFVWKKPFRVLTCVLSAFLACNNIHYTTLVVPTFLCLEYCTVKNREDEEKEKLVEPYYKKHNFRASLTTSILIFLTSVATLLLASYILMGNSWQFLNETYLYVLLVRDLTPNIGMFWYFFTEMFENFLEFFIGVFQINAFIHVIPLSIYLRDSPFFALYITYLSSTIFQPYPSLANVGMITSLLPQWSHLFPHMRHSLIVCCALVTCISLWPIFWHLWIIMGTANSNFYFGATLAFSTSLIFLMNDLLNAHTVIRARHKLELTKDKVEPNPIST